MRLENVLHGTIAVAIVVCALLSAVIGGYYG